MVADGTASVDPDPEVVARYRAVALGSLLPSGAVWPRELGSVPAKVLEGLAGELARLHQRTADLRAEMDPRSTLELLTEWEEFLGLPGSCDVVSPSLVLRRFAVVAKLVFTGSTSVQFYVDFLQALGYAVEVGDIEEPTPFQCGISSCNDPIYGQDWAFVWIVHAQPATPVFFEAGQWVCGTPIVAWTNDPLECNVRDLKPAHTIVHFAYDKFPTTDPPGWAPWEKVLPPITSGTADVPGGLVKIAGMEPSL